MAPSMSRPETSAQGEQHQATVQNDQDIIYCGANCRDEKLPVAGGGHENGVSLCQLYPLTKVTLLRLEWWNAAAVSDACFADVAPLIAPLRNPLGQALGRIMSVMAILRQLMRVGPPRSELLDRKRSTRGSKHRTSRVFFTGIAFMSVSAN